MLTQEDLSAIKGIIKEEFSPLNKDVSSLKKDVDFLKKGFRRMEKKLDDTINFFDHEHLHLRKRVDRIEDHLNLPSSS